MHSAPGGVGPFPPARERGRQPSRVPAHFEPGSVSFVSASQGFALGTSPCASQPCTALLSTANGSKTWAATAPPPAPFASASSTSSASVQPSPLCERQRRLGVRPDVVGHQQRSRELDQGKARWACLFAGDFGQGGLRGRGSCSPSAHKLPQRQLLSWSGPQSVHRPGKQCRASRATARQRCSRRTALTRGCPFRQRTPGPSLSGGAPTPGAPGNGCQTPATSLPRPQTSQAWPRREATCFSNCCAGNPRRRPEGKSLWSSTNGGKNGHVVSQLPLGGLCVEHRRSEHRRHRCNSRLGSQLRVPLDQRRQDLGNPHTSPTGARGSTISPLRRRLLAIRSRGARSMAQMDDRLLETSDGGATWSPFHF